MLSTDGGTTFTSIESGLPSSAKKSVVLDRSTDKGIYVAINGVVFFKSNAVTNWMTFSTNLPNVDLTELELYYGAPGESKVRIATYGRGVWESLMYDDEDGVNPGLTCNTTISSFPYNESFESGFGVWTQSSADDFDWASRTGGTPSSGTGPTGADDGAFYIYTEVSGSNSPSKSAILNSPCFDMTALNGADLSFSYHMLGSNVGTVDLEVTSDGVNWTSIWSQTGTQGSAWLAANIDVSAYTSSTVQFRFNTVSGTSWQGDICIDKFAITPASSLICNTTISSFPYNESFESGFGVWTQSSADDFDWASRTGGTPSSGTGPTGADDGAFYIYTEVSGSNSPSKSAILNSPCFDMTALNGADLSFSYHMLGSNVGTVDLEVTSDGINWVSIWSQTGTQGSAWLAANIDVSAYTSSTVQFRFNTVSGTSWQGDICIDKFAISEGY